MRKWLDQLKAQPVRKDYGSFEELAGIIRFRYPRFSAAQAAFVAAAWGSLDEGGRVKGHVRLRLRCDGRERDHARRREHENQHTADERRSERGGWARIGGQFVVKML